MSSARINGFAVFTFLAILSTELITASEVHWGYPDYDSGEDFPKWGGVCDSGKLQSPINLSLRTALKGRFDNLQFENYEDKQSGVTVVNNGHTIQLSHFPIKMELSGGPLLDDYVVEQIHLHWGAEHTVDNIRNPLEVHIVHRNKRYANMTTAANFKDGIAVIGILYVVSHQRSPVIDNVLEVIDEIKSYKRINHPVRLEEDFIVRDLFPHINGYFTYAGSLTTPSCAESVTWIVLHNEYSLTQAQLTKLREIEVEEGKQLFNNYRIVQKTNNRPVIVVLPESGGRGTENSASLPKLATFTSVLLLMSLLKVFQ